MVINREVKISISNKFNWIRYSKQTSKLALIYNPPEGVCVLVSASLDSDNVPPGDVYTSSTRDLSSAVSALIMGSSFPEGAPTSTNLK